MSPRRATGPLEPVSQTTALTVIAQDPSVRVNRRILTEQIPIPAEHLEPGPRGARFYVVDFDAASAKLQAAATVVTDGADCFADAHSKDLLRDPGFRAQNVYAIAASTLATAEAALGRRLAWKFEGHQLYLVPHAFPEANAFYSPEDGAIFFGYVPGVESEVQTALSHDVVAHETTHAILDGLRPEFNEPGLPDQLAFHEGIADCVALLSVFSLEAVVGKLLGETSRNGRLSPSKLSAEALGKTSLFKLAEQLGVTGGRGSALRRSVELEVSPAWRKKREFEAPHRRGEILVAAVMHTVLEMWSKRLEAITGDGGADLERVVEEGSTAATHMLGMLLRGIDYMPPVELEFEDVLDAVLTADEVMAPDDKRGYREMLERQFELFDVFRPEGGIVDISRGEAPSYGRMNFTILRSDRDEVQRFIWENAKVLGIDRRWQTRVQFVRPSVRIGPDGLLVTEAIADYVQRLQLRAGEARQRHIELPEEVENDTPIELWGGGVLVFDQFGRAKLHQSKPLMDTARQSRRLDYLAKNGLRDSRNRLGFSLSTPRGQRFAALHVGDERSGEDW